MNILQIIEKKRFSKQLSKDEIDFLMKSYMSGKVLDYQMSAFLMAVCNNGFSDDELYYFTENMVSSGEIVTYKTDKFLIDKHSTGGVGDNTTLIVLSILSSLGLAMPKASGRGLGLTGGTLDKIEAFDGIEINFSQKEIETSLAKVGAVIMGANDLIAPADKKLYALRDVSATTNSLDLIAASIASKKIASGTKNVILDIKCGKVAFMHSLKDAKKLTHKMQALLKRFGVNSTAIISNMDYPLGDSIGNNLEMIEVINVLDGKDGNLLKLSKEISTQALILSGKSKKEAKLLIDDAITSKNAKNQLFKILKNQKVATKNIKADKMTNLITFKNTKLINIHSNEEGILSDLDTIALANFVHEKGAGRKRIDDKINNNVGIILMKHIGDKIEVGDIIFEVLCDVNDKEREIVNTFYDFFTISKKAKKPKLIYQIIK